MGTNSQDATSFTLRAMGATAIALAGIAVLLLAWQLSQMLLMTFAGIMLAVFLDGISGWVGRHLYLPRPLALTVAIVGLFAFFVLAGMFSGPRITDQFANLTEKIPEAFDSLQQDLQDSKWGRLLMPKTENSNGGLPISRSEILGGVSGVFSGVVGFATGIFVIFFVGIYLAVTPRLYAGNIVRLLPGKKRERIDTVLKTIAGSLRWWLAGRFVSMAVVGVLTSLGLWIAGIPLALSLGLIAALFSFVPNIGPLLSLIPMILVALSKDPVLIIWVLVIYLAVQTLESYVITPMVQKKAVSIPPALLITAQIFMGVLFGVMGILLATPLVLVAIITIQMLYVEDVLGDSVKIMGKHE